MAQTGRVSLCSLPDPKALLTAVLGERCLFVSFIQVGDLDAHMDGFGVGRLFKEGNVLEGHSRCCSEKSCLSNEILSWHTWWILKGRGIMTPHSLKRSLPWQPMLLLSIWELVSLPVSGLPFLISEFSFSSECRLAACQQELNSFSEQRRTCRHVFLFHFLCSVLMPIRCSYSWTFVS